MTTPALAVSFTSYYEFFYKITKHGGAATKDGPLMVLAGPGSGKTTVVTRRVQYMVQEYGIPASSILVITFTKAAATEMKERYLRLMKEDHTNVSFGTFSCGLFLVS